MADFRIEGLDGVLRNMRELPVKIQKKALRKAGTAAMKIVRDAARAGAKARWDDPATQRSIPKAIVTKNYAKPYGMVTKVGVLGGAVSKKYTANRRNQRSGRAGKSYLVEAAALFHWRFLELGTSKMAARPVMRPALANNVTRVTNTYVSVLSSEIDKAIT